MPTPPNTAGSCSAWRANHGARSGQRQAAWPLPAHQTQTRLLLPARSVLRRSTRALSRLADASRARARCHAARVVAQRNDVLCWPNDHRPAPDSVPRRSTPGRDGQRQPRADRHLRSGGGARHLVSLGREARDHSAGATTGTAGSHSDISFAEIYEMICGFFFRVKVATLDTATILYYRDDSETLFVARLGALGTKRTSFGASGCPNSVVFSARSPGCSWTGCEIAIDVGGEHTVRIVANCRTP